jgi:ankyrin repeat protein
MDDDSEVHLADRQDQKLKKYEQRLLSGKVADILLQNGADVNAVNSKSQTPLHIACMFGAYDVLQPLLGHKSDHLLASVTRFSPFAKGTSINAKDSDGNTPLHLLLLPRARVLTGITSLDELVQLFLERGADPTVQNSLQQTPLHIAIENRLMPVCIILAKHCKSIFFVLFF